MPKRPTLNESGKRAIITGWQRDNLTQTELAKQFGVSLYTIQKIIREYSQQGLHDPEQPEQEETVSEPETGDTARQMQSAFAAVRRRVDELLARREEIDKELREIRSAVSNLNSMIQ